MTLYQYTEPDGETTIAVAESKAELSRMLGVSPSAVTHGIKDSPTRYHVIHIEEEDDE